MVSKDLVEYLHEKFMAAKGRARIASLKGAGMDFSDALPDEVRELLLVALEKGARTMSVWSRGTLTSLGADRAVQNIVKRSQTYGR